MNRATEALDASVRPRLDDKERAQLDNLEKGVGRLWLLQLFAIRHDLVPTDEWKDYRRPYAYWVFRNSLKLFPEHDDFNQLTVEQQKEFVEFVLAVLDLDEISDDELFDFVNDKLDERAQRWFASSERREGAGDRDRRRRSPHRLALKALYYLHNVSKLPEAQRKEFEAQLKAVGASVNPTPPSSGGRLDPPAGPSIKKSKRSPRGGP